MGVFNLGDKVIREDTGKKGIVVEVYPARRGRQLYMVNWGEYTNEALETELIADCDISNPYERCINGMFGTFSEFSQKNTSFKIRSSNNSSISSLKASKTLFRAYQFKPLLKFLNSPTRRLLVADEVGLGKTIEAGHIMLELKARRELRNVLIVCPKSLQVKWREELIEKFGLAFKIYDNTKDLISDLEDNDGRVRAIINYERIRIRSSKKDDEEKPKRTLNFAEYLSETDRKFSLVLCDEAHKMRNSETQTYKGADIVMGRAESAVFLTATPIMISTENLYNLLHLLDSSRYFNYQIFNARLQENRPFVEAISALNHNQPLYFIADRLSNAEIQTSFSNSDDEEIYNRSVKVDEAFSSDPIYQEIMERLSSDDNMENRARLQYLLNTMSVMNNIFSRTRKREVTTDMSQAERKPHLQKVVLTENEQIEFDNVIEQYIEDNSYTDEWGEEVLTQGGALGLVQKKRQVASSVYGYLNSEESLDEGIDEYADYEDAKFEKLIEIIEEVFKHGTKKLVVFALFRRTLKYLNIRLQKKGYGSLIIHGQVDNRADILESFKKNPENHILLSSEVGSEGLDMQFCNSMVNYDLPWNPMVVEQRIGRIDRFGQKSPVVNIYNLVVANSIQEDIYIRLLDRIGIFKGTIGDMEAILDAPISAGSSVTIQDLYNKLERELYISKLTDEEQKRKIDEISQAFENEKEIIRHLEEGMTDTLTNDAYFQNEIQRILHNNAYVTETELRNYLESVIDKHLTTCNLTNRGEDVYEIKVPLSDQKVFSEFLLRNQTEGEENDLAFRRFRRSLEEMEHIYVTFSQQKAYDDRSLLFLNIYHPIIQACLKYFLNNEDKAKTSFCYSLKSDDLLKAGSAYYLGMFQFTITRMVQGVLKHSESMQPFVFDISNREIVNNQAIIDRLYSVSQTQGYEYNPSSDLFDADLIADLRLDFTAEVKAERNNRQDELRRQAESERIHSEAQTKEYYCSRMDIIKARIKEREDILEFLFNDDKERRRLENIIRLDKGQLERLTKEMDERLAIINEDAHINVDEQLMSLNLIRIL
jgi:hypothetical protein